MTDKALVKLIHDGGMLILSRDVINPSQVRVIQPIDGGVVLLFDSDFKVSVNGKVGAQIRRALKWD